LDELESRGKGSGGNSIFARKLNESDRKRFKAEKQLKQAKNKEETEKNKRQKQENERLQQEVKKKEEADRKRREFIDQLHLERDRDIARATKATMRHVLTEVENYLNNGVVSNCITKKLFKKDAQNQKHIQMLKSLLNRAKTEKKKAQLQSKIATAERTALLEGDPNDARLSITGRNLAKKLTEEAQKEIERQKRRADYEKKRKIDAQRKLKVALAQVANMRRLKNVSRQEQRKVEGSLLRACKRVKTLEEQNMKIQQRNFEYQENEEYLLNKVDEYEEDLSKLADIRQTLRDRFGEDGKDVEKAFDDLIEERSEDKLPRFLKALGESGTNYSQDLIEFSFQLALTSSSIDRFREF